MLSAGWLPRGGPIPASHTQATSTPKRKIKETIMTELIQEPETPVSSTTAPKKMSRRNILMSFGIALNALAGVLFAVPVVGYIFGPARRKEMEKELAWIT